MAELHQGDVVSRRDGPFVSDWVVKEVNEHGAVLGYVPGTVLFSGFETIVRAPNGTPLTNDTNLGWLGRAHFGSAEVVRRG